MSKATSAGISRRSLLKGAAIGAAGVAAMGALGACSSEESSSSSDETASTEGTNVEEPETSETNAEGKHSWEVRPDPITDIADTIDTEVVIVGAGYSGMSCACNAAQNGAKVIVVEKSTVMNGHGVGGTGAIKSRALDDLGIELDYSIEMERWVSTCGMRCRESLVGKWFREDERCMNWLLDLAEADGAGWMVTVGSNSTVHPETPDYHMIFGGQAGGDEADVATYVEYLFKENAEATGNFELIFEMPAVQLVQENVGDKVTGVICQNSDGEYIQYNASKGVVLACGDISYNDEYIDYWSPMAARAMVRLCAAQGNVGDGHNMAAWAGGAFQDAPWPTVMHPQGAGMYSGPFMFLNPDGKRFMNEATWVQGKCMGTIVNGRSDHCWSIFDADWEDENTASLEYGGGMFWDSFRAVGTTYADGTADEAATVYDGLESDPDNYKTADTIDELLEQLDVDVDTAKETIEHYNEMCEDGVDRDFYKESHFLWPVEKAPFYAVKLGAGLLCVCGGVHISDNFEVLTADDEPIEGLYAIGNTAGDIYAIDYPINIQGNSHARCLLEGKCLGEQLAGVYVETA